MTDFKAGMRVRVASNWHSGFYAPGDTGTVDRVDDDGDVWVEFDADNHHPTSQMRVGACWCITPGKLEEIEQSPGPVQDPVEARFEFELWARYNGFSVDRDASGLYIETSTSLLFTGWLACASSKE